MSTPISNFSSKKITKGEEKKKKRNEERKMILVEKHPQFT